MTVLMTQVGPRVLPHDVLPDTPAPLKVVQWAQKEAGEPQALSGNPKKTASLGAHLGYSAAAGAMYGLARTALPPLRALPAPAVGVLFGLAVWAVSFECLLPALGVMKRTTEHAPKHWPAPLTSVLLIGDLVPRALSEQVVVLTGASSGVGRETALQLAERGRRSSRPRATPTPSTRSPPRSSASAGRSQRSRPMSPSGTRYRHSRSGRSTSTGGSTPGSTARR